MFEKTKPQREINGELKAPKPIRGVNPTDLIIENLQDTSEGIHINPVKYTRYRNHPDYGPYSYDPEEEIEEYEDDELRKKALSEALSEERDERLENLEIVFRLLDLSGLTVAMDEILRESIPLVAEVLQEDPEHIEKDEILDLAERLAYNNDMKEMGINNYDLITLWPRLSL